MNGSYKSERLLNLYLFLLSSLEPVTLDEIGSRIPGYSDSPSIEALRRMFHRDKNELKEKFGIDIICVESDEGIVGHRYKVGSASLQPEIDLTAEEAFVLDVIRRAIENSGVMPVADSLQAAYWKLAVDVPKTSGEVSVSRNSVSLVSRLDSLVDQRVYQHLLLAIKEQRKVSFSYKSWGRSEATVYDVAPLAMFYWRDAWYCVARNENDKTIRKFRLSRLSGLPKISDDHFDRGDFSIDELRQEDAWEWGDEPETEVMVRLDPGYDVWLDSGLHTIADRRIKDDDRIEASLLVRNTDAFIREILKLGTGVEILGPAHVKDRMRSVIRKYRELCGRRYEC